MTVKIKSVYEAIKLHKNNGGTVLIPEKAEVSILNVGKFTIHEFNLNETCLIIDNENNKIVYLDAGGTFDLKIGTEGFNNIMTLKILKTCLDMLGSTLH